MVNGGDVVCVEAGVYIEGDIAPASGGTPRHPVVFRAIGTVTLQPGPPPNPQEPCLGVPTTGFLLLGLPNVVIEGFTLRGFCDAGVQVRSDPQEINNSSGIVVRGNTVSGTQRGRGIDLAGQGRMLLEDNVVMANSGSGISVQGCIRAPDVEPKCAPGTTVPIEAVVRGNVMADNGSHGMFVRGTDQALIENNESHDNRLGAGIQLNASSNALVFNNLLYANGADGIRVGAPDRGTESDPLPPVGSPAVRLINNTIYGNGEWGIEIGEPDAGSPKAVVLNNIVQNNGTKSPGVFPGEIGVLSEDGLGLPSTCGYVAGFNLVENPTGPVYGPTTPSNVYDRRMNANFVAPGSDFRLRNGSPAIDAGYADVEIVGVRGSTTVDGVGDRGVADLGYHQNAVENGFPQIDTSIMPIFVRVSGRDSNRRPTTPDAALASIGEAARLARAGVEVVVGPGIYNEGDISVANDNPNRAPGSYIFRADPSGRRTGDVPGPVRLNAARDSLQGPAFTGFLLQGSCGARVEGFQVSGALEAGIQVQSGSTAAEVVHNQVFDNVQRGIQVVNASEVRIFNNLVYNNGRDGVGGGIQVGGGCPADEPQCPANGSPDSVVTFNTVFSNEVNGIFLGAGPGDSSRAIVRYNISVENRLGNALQIGNNNSRETQLAGLQNGYNLLDSFSDTREIDTVTDYLWAGVGEPLFVNAAASSFELASDSPAIDRAEQLSARDAGLDTRSTRIDRKPDEDAADLGYHYPILDLELAGDCDGDGRVSIAELVRGVNIALGRASIESCPAFDCNGDGQVGINELIKGVNSALVDA